MGPSSLICCAIGPGAVVVAIIAYLEAQKVEVPATAKVECLVGGVVGLLMTLTLLFLLV